MRKKSVLALLLTVCLLSSIFSFAEPVSAATDWIAADDLRTVYNFKDIMPSYVTDLDNVLYPSTSQYYIYDGLRGSGRFEVTKPTIVKAYYTWDSTGTTKISGQAWFSRDSQGIDIVGAASKLVNVSDSVTIFLDPGVYYVNHLFSAKQDKYSVYTRVGVALLAQDVGSAEAVYASSFTNPNPLTAGRSIRGFLSESSPSDYYKFQISEYSRVNISFNMESVSGINVGKGICTLYDGDNQKITGKTFNTGGKAQNQINVFLEPGTYYIELSGTVAPTNLKVDAVRYVVDYTLSKKKPTNKDVTLYINTDFEADEILIYTGKVISANIKKSSIWNTRNDDCTDMTGGSIQIGKNGYYTIRVKDAEGNYIMRTIRIKNIDKSAPIVTGVTNGKTYTSSVKISFADTNSCSAYLNKKKIASGTTVKEKGSYILVVKDKLGNSKTIRFTIK